ncbi:MAG: hypothetical protein U0169_02210 [Polyangiaceae bacterium]
MARILVRAIPVLAMPPAATAQAQELMAAEPPPPPPEPAKPLAYSIPWQLRPILAPTVVRMDALAAVYSAAPPSGAGLTLSSVVTAAYKIPGTGPKGSGLAAVLRFAAVGDAPPTGTGGAALVNPLLGATYAHLLGGGFRANAFLGVTLPIGMGGGDTPDAGPAAARTKGLNGRAQFDNALFAVNDLTVIPGLAIAYVDHGWTVQLEATLFQLTRVRGALSQPDASKTNFTTGLHVGYFVLPNVSVGADLRYQRWLEPPRSVATDPTGDAKDTASFAIGPRFHIPIDGVGWLRPGLSYGHAFDKPLAAAPPGYHWIQVDVPLFF